MRCENCQAEVSFWTTLRQSIPYRFQCFNCNARYRVSAPLLNVLFILIILIFAALLMIFKAGLEEFGSFFVAPFTAFLVSVWFVIEFVLYKYIVSRGKLTRMDKTVQEPPDPASGPIGE